MRNHTISFDPPSPPGLTRGIGDPASRYIGQGTYRPITQAFRTSCGYRVNINGVSYNPFYPRAFSPIAHNIIIDFDNNGNVTGVHGVRSGFPSLELWTSDLVSEGAGNVRVESPLWQGEVDRCDRD